MKLQKRAVSITNGITNTFPSAKSSLVYIKGGTCKIKIVASHEGVDYFGNDEELKEEQPIVINTQCDKISISDASGAGTILIIGRETD